MASNSNPLQIQIIDVKLQKFNKTDLMSIFPQFVELNLFQSVFEPVMKAEMLINDRVGLFTNYPLTGEELVQVTYKTLTGLEAATSIEKTLNFIIKGVRDIIVDDNARSMLYTLDLASIELLQSVGKNVSHAYSDQIENMAESLYNEYIKDDTEKLYNTTKPFVKEETSKIRALVVPNLKPLQAIQWLAKHAVAKDHDKRFQFLFFENIDGFNFVTIQKLIEDGKLKREELKQKAYTYRSDVESASKDNTSNDSDAALRMITNLSINKRYSSIEKISSGYYQNELFEISMLQKAFYATLTELDSKPNFDRLTLEANPLNTPGYIDYIKSKPEHTNEYANRVRYIINNYEDGDAQGKSQPEYRLKTGPAIQNLIALNQIDLTITVPANMDIKAGQIIYLQIPEMHSFNKVELDLYITGLYIVNEVKQVITIGNQAATTLRVYKDGYFTSIIESSFYNTSTSSRSSTVVDPGTGRPIVSSGGKGGA